MKKQIILFISSLSTNPELSISNFGFFFPLTSFAKGIPLGENTRFSKARAVFFALLEKKRIPKFYSYIILIWCLLFIAYNLQSQNKAVGINTLDPKTALHVADDDNSNGGISIGTGMANDGGNLRLLSNANHWNLDNSSGKLRFFTESGFGIGLTDKVVLTAGGRWGIGTTDPLSTLHVENDLVPNNNGFGIGSNNNISSGPLRLTSNINQWHLENTVGHLTFGSPAERLRLTSEGDLGIGTFLALTRLTILNSNAAQPSILTRGGKGYAVPFAEDMSFGHFNTSNAVFVPAMTIDPSGFMGIGTSTPGSFLDVIRNTPGQAEWITRIQVPNSVHSNYDVLSAGHGNQINLRLRATGELHLLRNGVIAGQTLLQVQGVNTGHNNYHLMRLIHGSGERFRVLADGRVGVNHVNNNRWLTVRGRFSVNFDLFLVERSDGTNVLECRNDGTVHVPGVITGNLGKFFQIDHPLDPENKTLRHACTESPEMKNLYDGIVVLNDAGEAWVELPAWFEALNTDFRYQLSGLNGHAPVYIAQKIQDKRFKIAGGNPGTKISWQVTGVRHDPYARHYNFKPEIEKRGFEKGRYHNPQAYGFPTSMAIGAELKIQ